MHPRPPPHNWYNWYIFLLSGRPRSPSRNRSFKGGGGVWKKLFLFFFIDKPVPGTPGHAFTDFGAISSKQQEFYRFKVIFFMPKVDNY